MPERDRAAEARYAARYAARQVVDLARATGCSISQSWLAADHFHFEIIMPCEYRAFCCAAKEEPEFGVAAIRFSVHYALHGAMNNDIDWATLTPWASGSSSHYAVHNGRSLCSQRTIPPSGDWTLNDTATERLRQKIAEVDAVKRATETPTPPTG